MRIRLYAYTGGALLRPQYAVVTEQGNAAEQFAEVKRQGGTRAELVAEGDFAYWTPADYDGWLREQMDAWYARQPIPKWVNLDTNQACQCPEDEFKQDWKRYRRLWE